MKYLIWVAIAAIVWWVWSKRQNTGADISTHQPAPEKMVACVHCGVHMPESEGVVAGDRVYCCEAHRLAAKDTGL